VSNHEIVLTPELLALPAPQSTRVIASARAADVEAAYETFVGGKDSGSGLHDLRVAVRRLRSWLRAHREYLDDTVRPKTRKRLKRIAEATNPARDAEVGLAWIAMHTDLAKRERTGATYVQQRLEREVEDATAAARKEVEDRVPRTIQSLSSQLSAFVVRQRVDAPEPPPRMTVVMRDVLLVHAESFAGRMGAIDSASDVDGVHRARIAVKRLRYVLEPLADAADVPPLLEQLQGLQTILGAIHDTHRVSNQLVREIGAAAARDARRTVQAKLGRDGADDDGPSFASIRPGLTTLAERSHDAQQTTYKQFRRRWRPAQVKRLVSAVEGIANNLG
jgi:CHAD domain-containing protein